MIAVQTAESAMFVFVLEVGLLVGKRHLSERMELRHDQGGVFSGDFETYSQAIVMV